MAVLIRQDATWGFSGPDHHFYSYIVGQTLQTQHALPVWLSSRQGLKQVAGEQPPLGCLAEAQPPTFLTLHENSCSLEKVKHGGEPRAKSCCRPTHSCCCSPEAGLTAVATVDTSDRFRIKQRISRRRHEKWHFFQAQIKHHNTSLEPRFICCLLEHSLEEAQTQTQVSPVHLPFSSCVHARRSEEH